MSMSMDLYPLILESTDLQQVAETNSPEMLMRLMLISIEIQ